MFLNEKSVFRCSLFEGPKLDNRQRDRAVNLCHFGPTRDPSLVVIAQSLDDILIYDLTSFKDRLQHGLRSRDNDADQWRQQRQQWRDSAVSHISIRDQVIESVSVIEIVARDGLERRDFLLIGCSKSIMIYDALNQAHLFSVNTLANIRTILASASSERNELAAHTRLLFCGGNQKLYTYQIQASPIGGVIANGTGAFIDLELSSERTISETATCLIHGNFGRLECLIVGFEENRIKLFSVDSLEMSIQTCQLTLTEASAVNCICSIETIQLGDDIGEIRMSSRGSAEDVSAKQSALPSLRSSGVMSNAMHNYTIQQAQMNYFAYGLESGLIGVYRLIETDDRDSETDAELPGRQQQQVSLFAERLWQHRAKQAPIGICLFDIDGDGLDELIIGYKNGRLEARSPFTGQLITSARCFRSGQLMGLHRWSPRFAKVDSMLGEDARPPDGSDKTVGEAHSPPASKYTERPEIVLLVCSTNGSLVAFKPRQRQPRRPLIDYLQQRTRVHRGTEGDTMIDSGPSRAAMAKPEMAAVQAQLGEVGEFAGDESEQAATLDGGGGDGDGPWKWTTSCESGQSSDLMQQLALKKKQQVELKQRLRQLQREFLRRQVTTSQAALELLINNGVTTDQGGLKHMTHCWHLEGLNLMLTLVVEYLAEHYVAVQMVELTDESDRFLPVGHLIIEPVRDVTQTSGSLSIDLILNSPGIHQARERLKGASVVDKSLTNEVHHIRVRVYLSESIAPRSAKQRGLATRNCILERAIPMPNFAMFVPETLVNVQSTVGDKDSHKRGLISKTFILPERLNRLQILDWMHSNFLCFQFDQVFDHENQLSALHGVDELWSSALYNRLEAKRLDASMAQSMRQFSANPSESGGDTGAPEVSSRENDNNESFDFRFIDLGTVGDSRILRRVRIMFKAKERRLSVQSNESDLLIDLIQQLAIDRLKLDLQADCEEASNEVEPLLDELKSMEEISKQLEESERRIETEIHESAELIKSLMQQLGIANELQMFSVSKELLSEISMLLDGTQNTAQAFYLNNRSRMGLVKQANGLRDKISFLNGDQDGGGVRDGDI